MLSIFTLFAISLPGTGQVTIGSSITPNKGALLDLKEQNTATPGGISASKGLSMPRVKLTKLVPSGADLRETINGATGTTIWNLEDPSV